MEPNDSAPPEDVSSYDQRYTGFRLFFRLMWRSVYRTRGTAAPLSLQRVALMFLILPWYLPLTAAHHLATMRTCFDSGKPYMVPGPEYEPQSKRWIDTRLVPMRNPHGDVVAVLGLSRDVTELKQAEDRLLAYHVQLRALATQLTTAEEQERRRIAVQLHDGVAQTLALCKIKIVQLAKPEKNDALNRSLKEIQSLIEESIRDTRSLTFDLSPPVLYELGFGAAVEWLAGRLREQCGLKVAVQGTRQFHELGDPLRIILFQSVRELLMNVVKHARVKQARVTLQARGRRLRVAVEDEGVGFKTAAGRACSDPSSGLGLFNIRERLTLADGTMTITSRPGRGTRIVLTVPIKPPPAARPRRKRA